MQMLNNTDIDTKSNGLIMEQLTWPPYPTDVTVLYLVLLRDNLTGDLIGSLRNLEQPTCILPKEWVQNRQEIKVAVYTATILNGICSDWEVWIPYYLLGEPKNICCYLRAPKKNHPFPFRIIVNSLPPKKEIILDNIRCAEYFPIPFEVIRSGSYYKFMEYEHSTKKWIDCTKHIPLFHSNFDIQIKTPRINNNSNSVIRPLFFTIDVEVNSKYQNLPNPDEAVDEQIFGITPGDTTGNGVGIGRIIKELDARKIKGTFFVDILMECHIGERNLRRIVDAILNKGHDVQLHLHPNPSLSFSRDKVIRDIGIRYARTKSVDSFKESMDLAVNIFQKYTGYAPIGFRNGAYTIKDSYFKVLKEYGIRYDSSVYAFKNNETSEWIKSRTTPFIHTPTGILEIPVTWCAIDYSSKISAVQHTIHLGAKEDMVSNMMKTLWETLPVPLVILIHSFSFLLVHRNRPEEERVAWNQKCKTDMYDDEAYSLWHVEDKPPGKILMQGVDTDRLAAFQKRLDMIASDSRIKSYTFSELNNISPKDIMLDSVVDPFMEYNRKQDSHCLNNLQRYNASYLEHLTNMQKVS